LNILLLQAVVVAAPFGVAVVVLGVIAILLLAKQLAVAEVPNQYCRFLQALHTQ
jgi:hypothetical protein